MDSNPVKNRKFGSRGMLITALFAGVMGLAFQIMPDSDLLIFMVTTAAVGGLVGGAKNFDERETQLLWRSFSDAFVWLFVVIYFCYALKVLLQALNLGGAAIEFLGTRWLGLTASAMCVLLGVAGMRNFRIEK